MPARARGTMRRGAQERKVVLDRICAIGSAASIDLVLINWGLRPLHQVRRRGARLRVVVVVAEHHPKIDLHPTRQENG